MKFILFLFFLSCAGAVTVQNDEEGATSPEQAIAVEKDVLKVVRGVFLKDLGSGRSRPIKGAALILKDHNNKKLGEAKTENDGSFQFSLDIENGPYSVYYESGDYHKLFNLKGDEKNLGEIVLE